jgi:hypothetical protein
MSSFKFTCAYGGNMIIFKPRFLKRRLGRQLLAAILGLPLVQVVIPDIQISSWLRLPRREILVAVCRGEYRDNTFVYITFVSLSAHH